MSDRTSYQYMQNVQRKIPGYVRLIQALLYVAVVIFTVIGASGGLLWAVPALGTLFGSWYFMGAARVTYVYLLEGTRLKVQRISGLKSRPKKEDFAEWELTKLRVMAPEGSAHLAEAERETQAAAPRRITYDVSAHDPDDVCSIMYLTGVNEEAGRNLKVYFQPSPELRRLIAEICPGKVWGEEDENS
ncbi:MAG: hypothetical protein Q4E13_08040 [Clostridia bacterium]|nr:hypothetical protein [Clostridia bacterium]